MSKQRNPQISLFDILEASKNCIDFTDSMDFESFENDLKTISAVLHQLMIIGEATKRLGKGFTDKHPVLPWKEIAGTRDILIHHYEESDTRIIWQIIQKELPKVIKEVQTLLDSFSRGL